MSLDHDRPANRGAGGGRPQGLIALVRDGVLDPELAALAWLLIEANVPAVVVGSSLPDAHRVRASLAGVLPPGSAVVELAGADESFAWMPEATELGWRQDRPEQLPASAVPPSARHRPGQTVIVADLDPRPAGASSPRATTWGEQALVAIRAVSIGYGMLATMRGARLEDVLSALAARPVGAMDDELTRLGMVLVLAPTGEGATRVVAAHYLRPVSRDAEGHVHRFGPAVLATWDDREERFEHFGWAITDELAGRIGLTTAELEREQHRRAMLLRDLAVGA